MSDESLSTAAPSTAVPVFVPASPPEASSPPAPAPGAPLAPAARAEFTSLFEEFAGGWPDNAGVDVSASTWSALRAIARRHLDTLCDMDRHGLDVSDAALLRLLPHEDSPANRSSEAWCHALPGITGDLRTTFEGAGWAQPEDWSALGRGLFDFVRRCDENPAEIWQAGGAFSALPGSRGFESGLLSPILNALRPDDFLVINAATRATLNHFTGSSFGSELTEYAQANVAARRLIDGLLHVLGSGELLSLRPQDSFASFCHWLMNVRLLGSAPSAPMPEAEPAASLALTPAPEPAAPLAEAVAPAVAIAAAPASVTAAAPVAAAMPPALTGPFELGEPFAVVEHGGSLAGAPAVTSWEERWLARLLPIIERKGQLVLCGPPGTGKTHLAERLAERLLDGSDGICERIAFHASWSYADFIQGLQPQMDRRPGRFTAFCRQAAARRGRCILLIDDLHRAPVAGIFGEALALLDRRGVEISLPGGGTLSVPPNVRILATLDTSSASQPLADLALARRFAAVTLPPGDELLRAFHRHTGFPVEALIETLTAINAQIRAPQRALGVAFFLRDHLAAELPEIWSSEVEPCLEHAFRDEPEQIRPFRWSSVASRILT